MLAITFCPYPLLNALPARYTGDPLPSRDRCGCKPCVVTVLAKAIVPFIRLVRVAALGTGWHCSSRCKAAPHFPVAATAPAVCWGVFPPDPLRVLSPTDYTGHSCPSCLVSQRPLGQTAPAHPFQPKGWIMQVAAFDAHPPAAASPFSDVLIPTLLVTHLNHLASSKMH